MTRANNGRDLNRDLNRDDNNDDNDDNTKGQHQTKMLLVTTESKWSRNLSLDSHHELNRLNFIEQQRHILDLRRQNQLLASVTDNRDDQTSRFGVDGLAVDLDRGLSFDPILDTGRSGNKTRAASASIVIRESRQRYANERGPREIIGEAQGRIRLGKTNHSDDMALDSDRDRESDHDLSLVSFSSMQSLNTDCVYESRQYRVNSTTKTTTLSGQQPNHEQIGRLGRDCNYKDDELISMKQRTKQAATTDGGQQNHQQQHQQQYQEALVTGLANSSVSNGACIIPLVETLDEDRLARFASEPVPPNMTYQCLIAIINNNSNSGYYNQQQQHHQHQSEANPGSFLATTNSIGGGFKRATDGQFGVANGEWSGGYASDIGEYCAGPNGVGGGDSLSDSFSNASIEEEEEEEGDETKYDLDGDDIIEEEEEADSAGSGTGHCGSLSRDISDDFKQEQDSVATSQQSHWNQESKKQRSEGPHADTIRPASDHVATESDHHHHAKAGQIQSIDHRVAPRGIDASFQNTIDNRIMLDSNSNHPSSNHHHQTNRFVTPTNHYNSNSNNNNNHHQQQQQQNQLNQIHQQQNQRPSIILAGRRRKKTKTYLIALDEHDITRKKSICKLKSNVLGTQFNAIRISRDEAGNHHRFNVASINYETNVLGFKGPRKMNIIIPDINYLQVSNLNLCEESKKANSHCIIQLRNKTPTWNEESESYVLNFHGRVTQASVKNFQLIHIPRLVTGNISDGPPSLLDTGLSTSQIDRYQTDGNMLSSSVSDYEQQRSFIQPASSSRLNISSRQQQQLERLRMGSGNHQCRDSHDNDTTMMVGGNKMMARSPNLNDQCNNVSKQQPMVAFTSHSDFIIMQFGRISEREFTCDVSHPLSLLQAFSIALSSFDSKLACE